MSLSTETKNICFEIRNLKKCYSKSDKQPVLNIEALDIYRGETTAVLGYSAAGKSTLLNLLGLLDELPDFDGGGNQKDSTIRYITGENIYRYERLSNREKIWLRRWQFGFVFQDHHLTSHLSVRRNILLPLTIKHISRKQQRQTLRELVAEAGLNETDDRVLRSLPFRLSGGQSLRVAVLRALAHSPQVLLADEPTGSLDPITGKGINQMIGDWQRADHQMRTVIFISHNFHQAWDVATRFIILKRGKIRADVRKYCEVNEPDDLLRKLN